MDSINQSFKEYALQLKKGAIQKAYRGIMSFMSGLKAYLEGNHPEFSASALYAGYMDMTYFALTPSRLKDRGLKVAVVFLHEEASFEIWLAGANRRIQAEQIATLRNKDIGGYTLSSPSPGVDAIVSWRLDVEPDFDRPEGTMEGIASCFVRFINDIDRFLG